jgi:putative ABC transport system permease protein
MLLARTLSAEDRVDVLENLDDLFARRVRTKGRRRAQLWYWWQAVSFGSRLRISTLSTGAGQAQGDRTAAAASETIVAALLFDLRGAVRSLVRAPRFVAAALATLVLGLAGVTLIWTIVYGTVLRPSGFPDADELVWVWSSGEQALTRSRFEALRPEVRDAIDLTGFTFRNFALTGGSEPLEVAGLGVSANHFDVLGVRPVVGRGFVEDDARAGAEPVAVISWELWQRLFDSDPGIVGRSVDLFTSAAIPMVPGAFTGDRHTIVGVAAPGYTPFGTHSDVIIPLRIDPSEPSFNSLAELWLVGRLADGVSVSVAREHILRAVGAMPGFEESAEAIESETIIPLQEAVSGHLRPAMMLSLAGIALVLLIACANVTNLLFVRTHSRHREFGVRRALGGTRSRLIRQQFAEIGILVLAGAILAILVARALLAPVLSVLPPGIDTGGVELDAVPLVFALALVVPTTLLCGGLPIFRRRDRALRSRAGLGDSRRGWRAAHLLVVAQVALALVLGNAAGQLIGSFVRLARVEPGFSATDVLTVRLAPSATQYRDTPVRVALYDRLLDRVRSLPDVRSAGAIHFLPIADGGPSVFFRSDPVDAETRRAAAYRVITPGYLETLSIEVRQGRALAGTDRSGTEPVGLINESLAEELWPGRNPLGRMLYRADGRNWFTVVGVVADVRQSGLAAPPHPEIYLPLAQSEWASAMTLVLRTGAPAAVAGAVRTIVHEEDTGLPVTRVATMQSILGDSIAGERFWGILFGTFAALALVLGGIGVYGVMAFVVARRTDEISVRMALGCTSAGVLGRELRRGATVFAIGSVAGLALTLAASRLLQGLLFGAPQFEPVVFGVAALVIGLVAVGAALVPARRAAAIEPMTALRFG